MKRIHNARTGQSVSFLLACVCVCVCSVCVCARVARHKYRHTHTWGLFPSPVRDYFFSLLSQLSAPTPKRAVRARSLIYSRRERKRAEASSRSIDNPAPQKRPSLKGRKRRHKTNKRRREKKTMAPSSHGSPSFCESSAITPQSKRSRHRQTNATSTQLQLEKKKKKRNKNIIATSRSSFVYSCWWWLWAGSSGQYTFGDGTYSDSNGICNGKPLTTNAAARHQLFSRRTSILSRFFFSYPLASCSPKLDAWQPIRRNKRTKTNNYEPAIF